MQVKILLAQVQEPTIACFIAWTFLSNLGALLQLLGCSPRYPAPLHPLAGTYIASFPLVPFAEVRRGFSVEEVGWLTLVSAAGNLALSMPMGFLFDWVRNKRAALAFSSLLAGVRGPGDGGLC